MPAGMDGCQDRFDSESKGIKTAIGPDGQEQPGSHKNGLSKEWNMYVIFLKNAPPEAARSINQRVGCRRSPSLVAGPRNRLCNAGRCY